MSLDVLKNGHSSLGDRTRQINNDLYTYGGSEFSSVIQYFLNKSSLSSDFDTRVRSLAHALYRSAKPSAYNDEVKSKINNSSLDEIKDLVTKLVDPNGNDKSSNFRIEESKLPGFYKQVAKSINELEGSNGYNILLDGRSDSDIALDVITYVRGLIGSNHLNYLKKYTTYVKNLNNATELLNFLSETHKSISKKLETSGLTEDQRKLVSGQANAVDSIIKIVNTFIATGNNIIQSAQGKTAEIVEALKKLNYSESQLANNNNDADNLKRVLRSFSQSILFNIQLNDAMKKLNLSIDQLKERMSSDELSKVIFDKLVSGELKLDTTNVNEVTKMLDFVNNNQNMQSFELDLVNKLFTGGNDDSDYLDSFDNYTGGSVEDLLKYRSKHWQEKNKKAALNDQEASTDVAKRTIIDKIFYEGIKYDQQQVVHALNDLVNAIKLGKFEVNLDLDNFVNHVGRLKIINKTEAVQLSGYNNTVSDNVAAQQFVGYYEQVVNMIDSVPVFSQSEIFQNIKKSVSKLLDDISKFKVNVTSRLTSYSGGDFSLAMSNRSNSRYLSNDLVNIQKALKHVLLAKKLSVNIADGRKDFLNDSKMTDNYKQILGEESAYMQACIKEAEVKELKMYEHIAANGAAGDNDEIKQRKTNAQKLIKDKYSSYINLIKLVEYTDLNLLNILKNIANNPKELTENLIKNLDACEFVSKWHDDTSGNCMAAVFDRFRNNGNDAKISEDFKAINDREHYYTGLDPANGDIVQINMPNDVNDYKNIITYLDRSFANVKAIDNVFSAFNCITANDAKLGKNASDIIKHYLTYSSLSVSIPVNDQGAVAANAVPSFKLTDRSKDLSAVDQAVSVYFIDMMKAITARVLVAIDAYTLYNKNVPKSRVNALAPSRQIIGGTTVYNYDVKPENFELYVRAPLLVAWYAKICSINAAGAVNNAAWKFVYINNSFNKWHSLISYIFDEVPSNNDNTPLVFSNEQMNKIVGIINSIVDNSDVKTPRNLLVELINSVNSNLEFINGATIQNIKNRKSHAHNIALVNEENKNDSVEVLSDDIKFDNSLPSEQFNSYSGNVLMDDVHADLKDVKFREIIKEFRNSVDAQTKYNNIGDLNTIITSSAKALNSSSNKLEVLQNTFKEIATPVTKTDILKILTEAVVLPVSIIDRHLLLFADLYYKMNEFKDGANFKPQYAPYASILDADYKVENVRSNKSELQLIAEVLNMNGVSISRTKNNLFVDFNELHLNLRSVLNKAQIAYKSIATNQALWKYMDNDVNPVSKISTMIATIDRLMNMFFVDNNSNLTQLFSKVPAKINEMTMTDLYASVAPTQCDISGSINYRNYMSKYGNVVAWFDHSNSLFNTPRFASAMSNEDKTAYNKYVKGEYLDGKEQDRLASFIDSIGVFMFDQCNSNIISNFNSELFALIQNLTGTLKNNLNKSVLGPLVNLPAFSAIERSRQYIPNIVSSNKNSLQSVAAAFDGIVTKHGGSIIPQQLLNANFVSAVEDSKQPDGSIGQNISQESKHDLVIDLNKLYEYFSGLDNNNRTTSITVLNELSKVLQENKVELDNNNLKVTLGRPSVYSEQAYKNALKYASTPDAQKFIDSTKPASDVESKNTTDDTPPTPAASASVDLDTSSNNDNADWSTKLTNFSKYVYDNDKDNVDSNTINTIIILIKLVNKLLSDSNNINVKSLADIFNSGDGQPVNVMEVLLKLILAFNSSIYRSVNVRYVPNKAVVLQSIVSDILDLKALMETPALATARKISVASDNIVDPSMASILHLARANFKNLEERSAKLMTLVSFNNNAQPDANINNNFISDTVAFVEGNLYQKSVNNLKLHTLELLESLNKLSAQLCKAITDIMINNNLHSRYYFDLDNNYFEYNKNVYDEYPVTPLSVAFNTITSSNDNKLNEAVSLILDKSVKLTNEHLVGTKQLFHAFKLGSNTDTNDRFDETLFNDLTLSSANLLRNLINSYNYATLLDQFIMRQSDSKVIDTIRNLNNVDKYYRPFVGQNTQNNNTLQVQLANIVDINVPPFNYDIFMKEIPFANVYNHSHTFDKLVVNEFKLADNEVKEFDNNAHNYDTTASKNAYAHMLLYPYGNNDSRSLLTVFRDSNNNAKFINDQINNKVLVANTLNRQVNANIAYFNKSGQLVEIQNRSYAGFDALRTARFATKYLRNAVWVVMLQRIVRQFLMVRLKDINANITNSSGLLDNNFTEFSNLENADNYPKQDISDL